MSDPEVRRAARLALFIALPLALIAGLVAFGALGGFRAAPRTGATPSAGTTAPVAIPAPSLPSGKATMCLAFIAHLPGRVRGLTQRPVTAGAEQNAAYGNPPIKVSCGQPAPSVAPGATVWTLSGTCWYADQSHPDATTWTTLDRQAPISITVPSGYPAPGGWVQEFTGLVQEWVPSLSETPKQCVAPSTAPS